MPKGGKLTAKQQAFVIAFLGKARGNGTAAARIAGYGRTERSTRQAAVQLLANNVVRTAVQRALEQRQRQAKLDAEARDQIASDIARNAFAEDRDRLRAIAELNKCDGRYSSVLRIKGELTLEQLAEASRATEPQPAAKTKD